MSATAADPREQLEHQLAELVGMDGAVLARLRERIEHLSNDELEAWINSPPFAAARWRALSAEARARLIAEALDRLDREVR
jgi:hypothetical protein